MLKTFSPLAAVVLFATSCVPVQSALHPRGAGADVIATMWWVMLLLAGAVTILVAWLALAGLRARSAVDDTAAIPPAIDGNSREGRRWILLGGIALPAVVLPALFGYTLWGLRELSISRQDTGLEIIVTGHQWWWDVVYRGPQPQQIIRSANELHLPVGERVRVTLHSHDVIHSFWVPALHGKLDMVPGRTHVTWIQANEPGTYRGQCAEFCGVQHANMAFVVVAHARDDWDAWWERESAPAPVPMTEPTLAGRTVFETRGCELCHTVRGTFAAAAAGPDLKHFASRQTLAAGMLPNDRSSLMGWLVEPQAIKPGNHMPRVPLSPDELVVLIQYLETLR